MTARKFMNFPAVWKFVRSSPLRYSKLWDDRRTILERWRAVRSVASGSFAFFRTEFQFIEHTAAPSDSIARWVIWWGRKFRKKRTCVVARPGKRGAERKRKKMTRSRWAVSSMWSRGKKGFQPSSTTIRSVRLFPAFTIRLTFFTSI